MQAPAAPIQLCGPGDVPAAPLTAHRLHVLNSYVHQNGPASTVLLGGRRMRGWYDKRKASTHPSALWPSNAHGPSICFVPSGLQGVLGPGQHSLRML